LIFLPNPSTPLSSSDATGLFLSESRIKLNAYNTDYTAYLDIRASGSNYTTLYSDYTINIESAATIILNATSSVQFSNDNITANSGLTITDSGDVVASLTSSGTLALTSYNSNDITLTSNDDINLLASEDVYIKAHIYFPIAQQLLDLMVRIELFKAELRNPIRDSIYHITDNGLKFLKSKKYRLKLLKQINEENKYCEDY
jgi:hypothetical protein